VRADESFDVSFEVGFDFVEGGYPTVDEEVDSLLGLSQLFG
jgi:hypothetical protein